MIKNTCLKTVILLGLAVLMILGAGCTASGEADSPSAEPYTTVSVDDIKESLADRGPITVGLDLDFTTFITYSVYYYGKTNIDGPDGTNLYGDDPMNSSEFKSAVNNEFVGQYLPKHAAADVISMHKDRGDNVIFITRKLSSPEERISDYIGAIFGIEDPVVIFTDNLSKTPYLNAENVSVYYGDSDTDITDAVAAENCTPYRFMRSAVTVSYYGAGYNPGDYNESVVENSDI